jgi:hypothetical protein
LGPPLSSTETDTSRITGGAGSSAIYVGVHLDEANDPPAKSIFLGADFCNLGSLVAWRPTRGACCNQFLDIRATGVVYVLYHKPLRGSSSSQL